MIYPTRLLNRLLLLGMLFSLPGVMGCSVLQSGGSAAAMRPSNDKGKLAIVPLRDARKGECLSSDELGFRFIPQESYTRLHLRLEQCNEIESYALRTDVRQSQPLMRSHFNGL